MTLHNGLKIRFSKGSAGSGPAARTKLRPSFNIAGCVWRSQVEIAGQRLSGVTQGRRTGRRFPAQFNGKALA